MKKKTKKSKRPLSQTKHAIREREKRANEKKKPVSTVPPKLTPYPQAGKKVTDFEDRLDESLGSENVEQKRGRGRSRKEEVEAQQAEIDIKVIGQALQIPFDLWSVSQDCPGLKISEQESVMIAKPVKQLLDYYMPHVPQIAWAWISLSGVSYSIVKSRLVLIAEIKKAKKDAPCGQEDAARGSSAPQGQGGPHPSVIGFPNINEIKKPLG